MLKIHLGWKEFLRLVAKLDMTFEYRWLRRNKVYVVWNSWIFTVASFLLVGCLSSISPHLPTSQRYPCFCFEVHALQGKLFPPLALEVALGRPQLICGVHVPLSSDRELITQDIQSGWVSVLLFASAFWLIKLLWEMPALKWSYSRVPQESRPWMTYQATIPNHPQAYPSYF